MKDKRNRHGAVGKSSSEQRFHKSAAITFIVFNKSVIITEMTYTAMHSSTVSICYIYSIGIQLQAH